MERRTQKTILNSQVGITSTTLRTLFGCSNRYATENGVGKDSLIVSSANNVIMVVKGKALSPFYAH